MLIRKSVEADFEAMLAIVNDSAHPLYRIGFGRRYSAKR